MNMDRIDTSVLLGNMQHIGGQKELTSKKDRQNEMESQLPSDQVSLNFRGEKQEKKTPLPEKTPVESVSSLLAESGSEAEKINRDIPKTLIPDENNPAGVGIGMGTTIPYDFIGELPEMLISGGPGNQGQPASSATEIAARRKAVEDDIRQANLIYAQMAVDRQKWLAKMWEIQQNTQTEIMQIMLGVSQRQAQMWNAINDRWAAFLGGYG